MIHRGFYIKNRFSGLNQKDIFFLFFAYHVSFTFRPASLFHKFISDVAVFVVDSFVSTNLRENLAPYFVFSEHPPHSNCPCVSFRLTFMSQPQLSSSPLAHDLVMLYMIPADDIA